METKHTPGPWFIDQFGHVYGWTEGRRIDSGGTQKDSVVLVDNRYSQAARHDKMLISSAPELLAALEECAPIVRSIMQMQSNCDLAQVYGDVLNRSRAAIRKARGEEV